MAGMSMVPMAAVSETAAPVMPAKKTLAMMLAWARPPRTWPARMLAKRTSLWVMPDLFMISPAKMKKGIAMSVNISKPEKYCRGAIEKKAAPEPMRKSPASPASPMVKPIGTPSARRVKNTTATDTNMDPS